MFLCKTENKGQEKEGVRCQPEMLPVRGEGSLLT